MTDEHDKLRPEVRCALGDLRYIAQTYHTGQQQVDILRAELLRLAEENKRLLGQNRIQSEFLSSRQCPDHAGKWERGKCLQCSLEKAEAELAEVSRMRQQLLDTIGANDQADAIWIIAQHHARELAQSEPPK